MHNRKAITPMRLWESLTDYDLWPVSSHVIRRWKQTDSPADLCTRLDCIYSTISSWDILNSHTPGAWLQPSKASIPSLLPSLRFLTWQHSSPQSSHYSQRCLWNIYTAWYHASQWIRGWTYICLYATTILDPPLPHHSASLERRFGWAMADICLDDSNAQLPCHAILV
jgi:hypothetical protein